MTRVTILSSSSFITLQKAINTWLEDNSSKINMSSVDIQFSTALNSEQVVYSVLIRYEK